ncbi:hypothetical protein D1646_04975 [Pseudoflavonifractor sp. 60]|uniref:hypothetical protein n=1 Tax=Pseudoflavonifractor sp. 60 TaxID=2304576 RepID=UPI00136975D3|nr:hypothetical protein [Pseudoflavonifractor sp. 60]NBI66174.1 hypothetical protein [Pseudoflavonifractor sp. 60]
MSWPWSQLGLSGPSSLSEVRHAYAEKLKTTHPEDDPEGFQRLHSAYQLASRIAREQNRRSRPFPRVEDRPHSRVGMREDDIMEIERPEEDFDYDQLLGGEGEPPRRPREEERDFDYDQLLGGEGESPRRPREEERDFDYDQLLGGEGEPPRRPREEEQDFDYDELLGGEEESPRRPREEEQDFDFDRLFAEGEAERAEARRRRGEERRKAKEQERLQRQQQRSRYEEDLRRRFHQDQRRWQDTETILHTIEMMYTAGAEPRAWRKFFASPLFQQNKGSLDLVFGLEDFVDSHPELDREVKMALYQVYGFEQGPARPELRFLYQMLLPARKTAEKERRRQKWNKVGSILCGLLLAPVLMALLAMGWFFPLLLLAVCAVLLRSVSKGGRGLGLLWLLALGGFTWLCLDRGWGLKLPLSILAVGVVCGVVRQLLRLGGQERSGMSNSRKSERWIVAVTAVCLAAGISMLFMPELRQGMDRLSAPRDPRAEVCRWMEEDFGVEFRSLYSENSSSSRFDNVFSPKEEPNRLFLAGPDGARDIEADRPGYTTNYSDMRVLWAMEDFAEAHNLHDVDLMNRNQNLASWDTSGTYLVILPFCGAGDTITDLGALLEELAEEDWYQVSPPVFKVVLCSEQLNDGRLILQEYESGEGAFDAQGLRELYENSFAQAYCAQLLRDCQLDRDFTRSDSVELYTLADGGAARMKGTDCWKLVGLDAGGQSVMEYYISADSDKICNIYCVPGDFWEKGGSEDQLHFYRLIHRETGLGLVYLHYPWLIST